jgi:4-amino-4-deoxy-L-arabinose transferase-like glycosyltransferase
MNNNNSLPFNKFIKPKYLLIIFVLLCLFFRTYKLETYYTFEHDQDLYSWIVKDILVDHHQRMIGQLTSIDGVFIGPLFYYLLVPFYALFNMNPLSAIIPILIISVLTVISIYYVFSKNFKKETGLIGAFIYSVSLGSAFNDRWIVPTQPTILWSVWYLYVMLALLKGNFKVLPIVGILVGLIWHIHIALVILLIPIPIAIFLSKKRLQLKI